MLSNSSDVIVSKIQDIFTGGLEPVAVHCNSKEIPSVAVSIPLKTGTDGFTENVNNDLIVCQKKALAYTSALH